MENPTVSLVPALQYCKGRFDLTIAMGCGTHTRAFLYIFVLLNRPLSFNGIPHCHMYVHFFS